MDQSKRIFVIARYKENLDWVYNLKGNIAVYNKSETFEYNFPRHDVENFGRETETFIKFIVQYYNQLDDYDSVVFLQGNPFDHCENILEKLNSIDCKSFEYLSDKLAITTFPNEDYFILHLSTMCRLFNIEHDWNIHKFSKSENDGNVKISSIRHLENCMALCYSLGIPTQGKQYEWASGCQYQVPVKMIKNKPLQWWLNIHNMHTFFSSAKKLDFYSYVLETIWPLIFKYNPSKGD